MNVFEAQVRNELVQCKAGQDLLRHQHDSEMKLEREKHQREVDALKQAARIAEQESTQRALGKATRQEYELNELKVQAEARDRRIVEGDNSLQAVLSANEHLKQENANVAAQRMNEHEIVVAASSPNECN